MVHDKFLTIDHPVICTLCVACFLFLVNENLQK